MNNFDTTYLLLDEELLDESILDEVRKYVVDTFKKIAPKIYDHIKKQHPETPFELQAFIEVLEKLAHQLNPKTIFNELKMNIKKHGWKLGLVFCFWELFEHFLMPGILAYFGLEKAAIAAGTLPWGELIVYPLSNKVLSIVSQK